VTESTAAIAMTDVRRALEIGTVVSLKWLTLKFTGGPLLARQVERRVGSQSAKHAKDNRLYFVM